MADVDRLPQGKDSAKNRRLSPSQIVGELGMLMFVNHFGYSGNAARWAVPERIKCEERPCVSAISAIAARPASAALTVDSTFQMRSGNRPESVVATGQTIAVPPAAGVTFATGMVTQESVSPRRH